MPCIYQDDKIVISLFDKVEEFSQTKYHQDTNWCICGSDRWVKNILNDRVSALVIEPVTPLRENECWGIRFHTERGAIKLECRNDTQLDWTSTLDDLLTRFPELPGIQAVNQIGHQHGILRLVMPTDKINVSWPQLLDKIKKNLYNSIPQSPSDIMVATVEPLYQFGYGYDESIVKFASMFVLLNVNLFKKDFDRLSGDIVNTLTINNIDDTTRRNALITESVLRPWAMKTMNKGFVRERQKTEPHRVQLLSELFVVELGKRISESIELGKKELLNEI